MMVLQLLDENMSYYRRNELITTNESVYLSILEPKE